MRSRQVPEVHGLCLVARKMMAGKTTETCSFSSSPLPFAVAGHSPFPHDRSPANEAQGLVELVVPEPWHTSSLSPCWFPVPFSSVKGLDPFRGKESISHYRFIAVPTNWKVFLVFSLFILGSVRASLFPSPF